MKTRTTELTVLPEGELLFSDRSTFIKITDEGGGEFLEISQTLGKSAIRIDPDEWAHIRAAIDSMVNEVDK